MASDHLMPWDGRLQPYHSYYKRTAPWAGRAGTMYLASLLPLRAGLTMSAALVTMVQAKLGASMRVVLSRSPRPYIT